MISGWMVITLVSVVRMPPVFMENTIILLISRSASRLEKLLDPKPSRTAPVYEYEYASFGIRLATIPTIKGLIKDHHRRKF